MFWVRFLSFCPGSLNSNAHPWLEVAPIDIYVIFNGRYHTLEVEPHAMLSEHWDYTQTAVENCKKYARKTSFDL